MNLAIREEIDFKILPLEAAKIVEILNQLENHTAELRKKLMSELRPKGNSVKLSLDQV